VGEADIAAAEGFAAAEAFGSGFGAGFCFFLASALWAFADCAEDSVAVALVESELFVADCADADAAQAITVKKARAVVHIVLPMPAAGPALTCSWTLMAPLHMEPVRSREGLRSHQPVGEAGFESDRLLFSLLRSRNVVALRGGLERARKTAPSPPPTVEPARS